jgi:DNA-binding HxlR family transcriptional regulator
VKGYTQFCPIAKAAEILTERWTVLVLRDLLHGSRRFNEFRRGVPTMSPTLLVKRLETLQEHGLVERVPARDRGWEYHPTRAAEELRPLIAFMGHWGQRWVRSRLTRDELDPGVLMWFIHRHFVASRLPPRRVVIAIEFTDARQLKMWWVVVDRDGSVDLCLDDPGLDVDIAMRTDVLALTQVYIGDLSFRDAWSSGKIDVRGPAALTRTLPEWFARSRFADTKLADPQRPDDPPPALLTLSPPHAEGDNARAERGKRRGGHA